MLNSPLTVRRVLLALVAASIIPTLIAAVVFLAYIYNDEQAGLRQGIGKPRGH